MTEHDSIHGHADAATETPSPTPRRGSDPLMQVRASDVEPYTGLGYLSKLFKLIAVFLVLLLVVEIGTGLYQQGTDALPTLLSEASRLVVLAGLLWGVGDLANLLIDLGHDVRAARILLGRLVAQGSADRAGDRGGQRVPDHTTTGLAASRAAGARPDEPMGHA
jgi:hypothetical protein